MALSDEMAVLAVDLIDEFGAAVTISRVSGGTYDPATQKITGGTPATQSPKCLTENKGLWLGASVGVVGEKKLTVAAEALTFVPVVGNTFTHGGKTYAIMDKGIIATEVMGVPVLYEIYGVSA